MRKTASSGSLDEPHRPVFLKSKDATVGKYPRDDHGCEPAGQHRGIKAESYTELQPTRTAARTGCQRVKTGQHHL